MTYCWEVYKKSECDHCEYFRKFSDGTLDLDKAREIVLLDPEVTD